MLNEVWTDGFPRDDIDYLFVVNQGRNSHRLILVLFGQTFLYLGVFQRRDKAVSAEDIAQLSRPILLMKRPHYLLVQVGLNNDRGRRLECGRMGLFEVFLAN